MQSCLFKISKSRMLTKNTFPFAARTARCQGSSGVAEHLNESILASLIRRGVIQVCLNMQKVYAPTPHKNENAYAGGLKSDDAVTV